MENKIIFEQAIHSYNIMNCKLIQLWQKFPNYLDEIKSLELVICYKSAIKLEEYELASFINNVIKERNKIKN